MGAFMMVEQDPEAELDYTIDWSQWLNGGSLSVGLSGFTADAALDIVASNVTAEGLCTVRIGVTEDAVPEVGYEVVNFIERDDGQKDNRTILVTVREK